MEAIEGHSFLDGLDHLAGIAVLAVMAMIGLDLYFWLGLNKPPKLAILWMPPLAVNMWRRTLLDIDKGPWPVVLYRAMAVYSVIVLAVVLIKRPATWDDWTLAVFAAMFAGSGLWKAIRP